MLSSSVMQLTNDIDYSHHFFFADVFSQQKKIEISTPYDPVHLTHVGFNSDTGEFTVSTVLYKCIAGQSAHYLFISSKGLPKEWQQLLQNSGITKEDQAANPQAVMDIVAFYQDATQSAAEEDAVWKKFGSNTKGTAGPMDGAGKAEGANPAIRSGDGVYEKPVSRR